MEAICRKVIEGIDKNDLSINIWGNGKQTGSLMFIDDCVRGIDLIMHRHEPMTCQWILEQYRRRQKNQRVGIG